MIIVNSVDTRQRAAKVIAQGGVLAFRTDTFYGLGANPFDERALRRLNRIKGREAKPILVIISDAAQATRFVEAQSILFEALATRHWPGALTIVECAHSELSDELTAGTKTIGVRLPFDERVREFVKACGGALTATSANLVGATPARTALEVAQAFSNELDLIVDSGTARGEKPSTVLDVSDGHAHLIREGAVPVSELVETLQSIGMQLKLKSES